MGGWDLEVGVLGGGMGVSRVIYWDAGGTGQGWGGRWSWEGCEGELGLVGDTPATGGYWGMLVRGGGWSAGGLRGPGLHGEGWGGAVGGGGAASPAEVRGWQES